MRRIAPALFVLCVLATWRTAGQESRLAYSILTPDADWSVLEGEYQLTADSAVLQDGTVYFTSARHNRIYRIDPEGHIHIWKENSGRAHGIAAGPDGVLYAGQHDRKRIVALDSDGRESIVAEGLQTHHLTISKRGDIYYAEAPDHTVAMLDRARVRRPVTTAVNWPHGLRLSPDESQLFVTDSHTRSVWSFPLRADGTLSEGKQFALLETRHDESDVDAGSMTFDTAGKLYVATKFGVQVFDRTGKQVGRIDTPAADGVSAVFFAGTNLKWLYVTDGVKFYRHASVLPGAPPFGNQPQ